MGELSSARAVSQALVCVCLTRGALAVQVSVALALVGSGGRGLLCVCRVSYIWYKNGTSLTRGRCLIRTSLT